MTASDTLNRPDIGIGLFMLANMDESLPDVLRRVGKTELTCIEFAEFTHPLEDHDRAELETIADALDESGLRATSTHVAIEKLETRLGDLFETYSHLGIDTFVTGLGDEYYQSTEDFEAAVDRLTALGERIAYRGGRFCYHNHDHAFTEIDGRIAYERLVEATPETVGFELDAEWASISGHDPVEILDRHGDRMPIVHLKDADVARGRDVEIGAGDVGLQQVVNTAIDGEVEALVYEFDHVTDPYSSLERGSEFLSDYLEASER